MPERQGVAAVGFLLACAVGAVGFVAVLGALSLRLLGGDHLLAAGLVTLVLLVVVCVATSLPSVVRRPEAAVIGLPLLRRDHPDLWDDIAAVARQVGCPEPEQVQLVLDPVVAVREVAGRLHLDLGVPLLLTLERGQLEALVAHELALHRGGLSGAAVRLDRTLAVSEDGPLERIVRPVVSTYLRLDRPVDLHRAMAADRVAARVAGTRALVGALRQQHAVDAAWSRYLCEHALTAPGLRPQQLFDGFDELWHDGRGSARTIAAANEPSEVELRVGRLLERPVQVAHDTAPARGAVRRAAEHLRELEEVVFHRGDRVPAGWDDIAARAGGIHVATRAALLPDPLESCILDLAPRSARALVADLLPTHATRAQVRALAIDLVAAGIEAGLLERGGARFVSSWQAPRVLVDEEGRRVDVRSAVEAAWDDERRQARLLASL